MAKVNKTPAGKNNTVKVVNIGESKRYVKWNAPKNDDENFAEHANDLGIVGTLYIPKDADLPDSITIEFVK